MSNAIYIRYVNPYQTMSGFKRLLKYLIGDEEYFKYRNSSPDHISEIESVEELLNRIIKQIDNLGTNYQNPFILQNFDLIHNDIFRIVEDDTPQFNLHNIYTIEPIYVSYKSKYKLNKKYRLIILFGKEKFEILREEEVRNIMRRDKLKKLKSL